MANIVFRIPHKLNILADFTKETLDKIVEKMRRINKDLGSNKCNFNDFDELITLENIKPETLNIFKQIHYGIEYVNIEINSEFHKIITKRKMNINPLQTFKEYFLHTEMISKTYKIESNINNVVKLEGLEREINLKEVKYEYIIN